MNDQYQIHVGDCLDVMRSMDADSVDAVVTDPPYGISFMGKKWDYAIPSVEIWAECLRVLKPGGFLLSFASTRTQHRMAVNIEDAGFEIRDTIAWVYGSGFPKSHNISKAIDKMAGAEREVVDGPVIYGGGHIQNHNTVRNQSGRHNYFSKDGIDPNPTTSLPATEEAKQWDGWGTALKPAFEPITVARKPFKGTVAANVLKYGTGGINVDGCRVGTEDNLNGGFYRENADEYQAVCYGKHKRGGAYKQPQGRFPANLIHDGSEEVLELFPELGKAGTHIGRNRSAVSGNQIYASRNSDTRDGGFGDSGSAARFFYCAKANKTDRGENNGHPTVKPTDLMRYLCRLVTQPGGLILDPYMGSGTTGKAAMLEGFRFVGAELSAEYATIAETRIVKAAAELPLFPMDQPSREPLPSER